MNNKILILEICDDFLKTTLVLTNPHSNILFDEKLKYKNDGHNNIFNFDFSWLEPLNSKLKMEFNFDLKIEKMFIIFNSSHVFINTEELTFSTEDELENLQKEIKNQIKLKFNDQKILNLSFVIEENKLIYHYELINKELFSLLENYLIFNDISNFEFYSYLEIQNYSLNDYKNIHENLIVIDVYENHFIFSNFKKGELHHIYKKFFGLKKIYQNISQNMNINYSSAKKLFLMLGKVPPESILDNKIIHTSENENSNHVIFYSQKDLSICISENLSKLFDEFLFDFFRLKTSNTTILFSGEINSLKGILEYTKIRLNLINVISFRKNIIGIKNKNFFLVKGFLNYIYVHETQFFLNTYQSKWNQNKSKKNSSKIKKSVKSTFFRFFSYLK